MRKKQHFEPNTEKQDATYNTLNDKPAAKRHGQFKESQEKCVKLQDHWSTTHQKSHESHSQESQHEVLQHFHSHKELDTFASNTPNDQYKSDFPVST